MRARMIDQMHIMNARGTGCHARQTGEAAINMLDHFSARRAIILQHILDEINAATRTIQFIAQEEIGRARRRAKAAMDTAAQDFFRFSNMAIGQLNGGEISPHQPCSPRQRDRDTRSDLSISDLSIHAPRIEQAFGIKTGLDAGCQFHHRL